MGVSQVTVKIQVAAHSIAKQSAKPILQGNYVSRQTTGIDEEGISPVIVASGLAAPTAESEIVAVDVT
jgi:hypothetical protein